LKKNARSNPPHCSTHLIGRRASRR
jgi:hypothetical protein